MPGDDSARRPGVDLDLRERMVRERARFIEDYEDNIDQARLDLGKLFRIEDYLDLSRKSSGYLSHLHCHRFKRERAFPA